MLGQNRSVVEMRVDRDQAAIRLKADPAEPACHTGETRCFHRKVTPSGPMIEA